MDVKEFLKELTTGYGVSGYEGSVAESVEAAFRPYCDEIRRDPLGNVIGIKKGCSPGPRVMLAAHMDEIGLMVTEVIEGGFLRFTTVGGFDQRTLPGQEVLVHGKETLLGIIGAKPPHLTTAEDRRKSTKISDLYIDLGLPGDKSLELVKVGDLITLKRDFIELQRGFCAAKAMDDRACVASVLEMLRHLDTVKFNGEVYAVATVQEEVGVRGAFTSSYSLNPDIGIAIDVCHGEMPGVSEDRTSPMDKGPALDMGPHVHYKVLERLKQTADEYGIPYCEAVSTSPAGTDAFALQMAQGGIPTALVSLPLRYMHTSVETLALNDVKRCGRLLAQFIASLDSEFVEGLRCY